MRALTGALIIVASAIVFAATLIIGNIGTNPDPKDDVLGYFVASGLLIWGGRLLHMSPQPEEAVALK
jgi:hypothetical protein